MRIITYLLLAFLLAGCHQRQEKAGEVIPSPVPSEQSMSLEELDDFLDSLTAQGEYCLVRGSDREYDTIIDHVRYIYVKDGGYDTPVKDKEE